MTSPLPDVLASRKHVHAWLCEPLSADVTQSLQRLAAAEDVQRVAVMPDVHLAGEFCIGTVVATNSILYPGAVGSDIGCGMAAVGFDASAELLNDERVAARILTGLYESVPTTKHSRHRSEDSQFEMISEEGSLDLSRFEFADAADGRDSEATDLSDSSLAKAASRDGRLQLGTLGRGNHFIELQADTENRLWLMLHSGSRAMGQAISRFYQHRTRPDAKLGLACLDSDTPDGRAYIGDVAWAVAYAKANRLVMVQAVAELMERLYDVAADWTTLIHGNHNHVRQETHGGRQYWVHRKGALPASDGEPGVIPGSMGTRSYHTIGRGDPLSLNNSSHGAGRRMARKQAVKAIRLRDFERQMRGVWFDNRKANALRDEAPEAYRDIGQVMRAQNDLTRISRELRPLLSYKGT